MSADFQNKAYRNRFSEAGIPEDEIDAMIRNCWQTMFFGPEELRIYHESGPDMGYMVDTGNLDVRTEGMSYGMMMAVQMDDKDVFDRIWLWSWTHMLHREGICKGYFAWSCALDGARNAQGPAPDGEEYYAMALFFASHRWGDGTEPYDYSRQARAILHECVHKGEIRTDLNGEEVRVPGDPMWDPDNKLIKFIPETPWSDPSYHLPHFYELFSLWADEEDSVFWKEAAAASRLYLVKACHPETGLAPEYADFDGTPHSRNGHTEFYSDSYRVAANIGLDCSWFGPDAGEVEIANRIQAFFKNPGLHNDYRMYLVDGTPLEKKSLHPYGLIATNAMASLAADGPYANEHVLAFRKLPLRTGDRRYYDNCLYFFACLALAGRYRIW